ncbi:bifunctional tetrahydrofolate synthase/dihydrofolate synthase [Oceanicoccus sagamiensis]|uniref:Dihydrofolate synthase/folylpolyglutamate synthase n=1 Tax=Oceanicoccus sagamiensis TaxID=716816 RepID=A0A1X9NEE6_9GAMM|nr:bifunctional tetrahydrofolate synthase/dihydrofolate synthase [Oceanicoccus sagamiensis]ARN75926.1 bifunctional tetrahydrofolate synthase/dihydrofolate synthase [Oceanicoccus sagamiensis]
MRFDQLQDWLEWQESCHPSEIELGLERVASVAQAMAISLTDCQVITVAGTNGKGSCVATLNALLLSAGYRVGCYTSPHFIHYNERVMLNGVAVSDRALMESFQRIDDARADTSLTYFEFGTLAALDIFERSALDVVVLEVGLGGRLDAVNIIDADIAVVTSIDVDHQDWLGSDREQIGREKAGVFRANKPAISAGLTPPQSLRQAAQACGAEFYQAGESFVIEQGRWAGLDKVGQSLERVLPELKLPAESVAAAIQAIYLLPLSTTAIDFTTLATVQLPGRFQTIMADDKQLILDVAHNPAAASYLSQRLQKLPCKGRTFSLLSVMKDKDLVGIVTALREDIDVWCIADQPDNARSMPADNIVAILEQQGAAAISQYRTIGLAYQEILAQMEPVDRLVVFGSFFTVAEVLQLQADSSKLC